MSKPKLKASVATHVLCIALASEEGQAPEWVKLMPYGTFRGRDGRGPYILKDKAAAEAVIAASQAHSGSADPVFDYCHQTDLGAVKGVGGVAPASGWIKELQARDDGIYGRVEWTAAASSAIAAKEYRYASPVFTHTKSGQVVAILRASLTNTPNLDLPALASEQLPGDDMDLSQVAQALGLGAEATLEQVLEAIANLKTSTATASEMARVRKALKLGEAATCDEVVTAIASVQTGGELAEQVISLQSELTDLRNERTREKAEGKVDAAIASGKVPPAMRDHYVAIASETPDRFDAMVGAMPVIVKPGATDLKKVDPDTIALTDEDKAICSQMGLDEAAFLETKKKEIA